MAIEDAILALRDHWDDVVSRLGAEKGRQLRELAGELGGPQHSRAVSGIADLLVEELLPHHPVRRALVRGYLFRPATIDWPELAASLPELRRPPSLAETGAGSPVLADVMARLLRAPALDAGELQGRGAEPDDDSLIRLDRPGGGSQWPEFQFDADGELLPVVRAVNELLQAASDPVGAADWWLSRNAWLDGQPSLLIGRVPDDHLIRAARAVGAEV